jgi:hypothetical protein
MLPQSSRNFSSGGNTAPFASYDWGNAYFMHTSIRSLTVVFALASASLSAQTAFRLGAEGTDYGKDITTDAAGNLYVTGYFQGTVDFDPGAGVTTRTAQGSSANPGAVDIFVAKYSPAGVLQFVFTIGGAGADMPHTIRVAPNGDIGLTGYFSGTVDFDPGPGTTTLNAGIGRNAFVARYSPTGDLRWAVSIGDPEPSLDDEDLLEEGMDLAFDATGNTYACGIFNGTVRLAPGAPELTSSGIDSYVASYDPEGRLRWGFALGGAGREQAHALKAGTDGMVYVGGFFGGTVDFDPSPNTAAATATGTSWDVFLAKYRASDGAFQWVRSFGGAGNDQIRPGALALGPDGDVWTGGDFTGTTDFDPGPGATTRTSAGLGDCFLSRYSAAGDFKSVITFGGTNLDFVHRLIVTPANEVYATGSFRATVDFDPGPATATVTATAFGGGDAFLAKYDANGALRWVRTFGSPAQTAAALGLGAGIALAPNGIVFTGRFAGPVDFDPSPLTRTLTGEGNADVMVVYYNADGLLEPAPVTGGNGRLLNLSTRGVVLPTDPLIAGLVIADDSRSVLIRAVGPALTGFGVANALANPVLVVTDAAGREVARNDDWDRALAATFARVGAFPFADASRDAALVVTLPPGTYTAQVTGGTTGTALVEVYTLSSSP